VTAPDYPRGPVRLISFLWGLQFSFVNPSLALLLASVYGASTAQVSLALAISSAAGLLAAWLIPRWCDRRADYIRPLIGCGIAMIGLCLVLGLSSSLPLAVLGLVVFGAPAGVGVALLFGFVSHTGGPPSEVVRTRAVFSASWVAGPPVASGIIALAGGHALVWVLAGVTVVNIAVTTRLLRARVVADVAPSPVRTTPARVPRTVVALLVVAFALLATINSATVSITTLFVSDDLGLSPLWGGVALGVAAGLEVPVLLLIGRHHGRLRDLTLLTFACVLCAGYGATMALAHSGLVVIAAQLFNAGFVAIIAGAGLTLFQALIPGPSTAAGAFSNAQRLGGLLAGPLIGLASVAGGLRTVFAAGVLVALVSLVVLRLVARLGRREVSTRP